MNLEKSLNEYIGEQVEQDDDKKRFRIEDDQSADWALSKIIEAKNELDKIQSFAKSKVDNIKTWEEESSKKHLNSIDYFESILADYAMRKRQERPDFKSIKLPNGKFEFRKKQPKWEYDEKKIVKTLKENGMEGFIRVKESPDKAAIKKNLIVQNGKAINPETGEFVEGITVIDQGEGFNVKVQEGSE